MTFKQELRIAIICGVIAGLYGCASGGGSKPPNPIPTPTPSTTKYDDLLLSAQGPTIVDAKGQPFDFKGYAGCCRSDDGEPPVDWALTSNADMDRIKAMGFNVVHIRIGPYNALADSPPSLIATGGPYVMVEGKADLTRWNPAFWTALRERLEYGGKLGLRFEVDVVDGWGCKLGSGGTSVPGYHPWKQGNNVQGQDFIQGCGTGELVPGYIHEAWVRKVYFETVDFSNVFYQEGNEIQLVGDRADNWRYSPAWTASLGNHLRDVEAIKKTKRHLFGSNVASSITLPQVDYGTIHSNDAPTDADRRGTNKPVFNNEYNPEPAFTPEMIRQLYCKARANGTYLWYWRHSQSKAQFEETARLLREPCGNVVSGCTDIPNETAVKVVPKPDARYAMEINACLRELTGSSDATVVINEPLHPFLFKLAQCIRTKGLCAGVQTDTEGPVDQVCAGDPVPGVSPPRADVCQGNHSYACVAGKNCQVGTVAWAPGSYLKPGMDAWKRP